MAKVAFKQANLMKLKGPTDGKPAVYYWDENFTGLGMRVSKRKRSWVAAYTVAGRGQVMETLGNLSLIPKLVDARDRAREAMLKARSGITPVEERRQKEAHLKAEASALAMTFALVADAYIERYAEVNNKPGTLRETRRHLAKASAFFGNKPLRDLDEADIAKLIEARSEKALASSKRGRAEASNLLAVVGRCLRWGNARSICRPGRNTSPAIPRPIFNHQCRKDRANGTGY
jgi:hypothetical protein